MFYRLPVWVTSVWGLYRTETSKVSGFTQRRKPSLQPTYRSEEVDQQMALGHSFGFIRFKGC